jgi:hypothetical protein
MSNELGIYNDTIIKADETGYYSLTDMWKANSKDLNRKPQKWIRQDKTINLLKELEKSNGDLKALLKTTFGRYGGTWGTHKVALAYAEYLSPEFHVWALGQLEQSIEYEKNPEKAVSDYKQKCIDKWLKEGKSWAWIGERLDGKNKRNDFMESLGLCQKATQKVYIEGTNMVNRAVLGTTAKKFRKTTGVDTTRDGMSETQILAIALAEKLLADAIEDTMFDEGYLTNRKKLDVVAKTLGPLRTMMKPHHVREMAHA